MWQALHLKTSTFTLCGVALGDIDVHSEWQAWHLWRPSLSVAGMALGDIDLRFAAGMALGDIGLHFVWKAWRLATSTCILRGVALMALVWLWWRVWFPFGTVVAAAVCVAGVALGDIDLHFLWQAWRLATSTCILWGKKNMQQNR